MWIRIKAETKTMAIGTKWNEVQCRWGWCGDALRQSIPAFLNSGEEFPGLPSPSRSLGFLIHARVWVCVCICICICIYVPFPFLPRRALIKHGGARVRMLDRYFIRKGAPFLRPPSTHIQIAVSHALNHTWAHVTFPLVSCVTLYTI